MLDLNREIARKRLQRRLSRVYDFLFSGVLSAEQKSALADRFFRLQRYLNRLRGNRPTRGERS
jgi:hypothetical protein